jgi:catechol 2,3-dioxygenase-like lactoylglutathione lyase family enzyme
MSHSIIHFEIMGTDPSKSQKFYADMFGWKLGDPAPELGNYAMVDGASAGLSNAGPLLLTANWHRVRPLLQVHRETPSGIQRRFRPVPRRDHVRINSAEKPRPITASPNERLGNSIRMQARWCGHFGLSLSRCGVEQIRLSPLTYLCTAA